MTKTGMKWDAPSKTTKEYQGAVRRLTKFQGCETDYFVHSYDNIDLDTPFAKECNTEYQQGARVIVRGFLGEDSNDIQITIHVSDEEEDSEIQLLLEGLEDAIKVLRERLPLARKAVAAIENAPANSPSPKRSSKGA